MSVRREVLEHIAETIHAAEKQGLDGLAEARRIYPDTSITFVAHRQIAQVPGQGVLSDKVITANIRASLPAMFLLRETINTLERMAKEQLNAVAEAAANEAEVSPKRPH